MWRHRRVVSDASFLVLLVLTGLAWTVPARAQQPIILGDQGVRGRLADPEAHVPIVEATITLIRGDERVRATLSDESGYFYLPVPSPGEYRLEASRLGYFTTLSKPFEVPEGATVTVQFSALPDALPIAPLVVTAVDITGMNQFLRHMDEWGKGIFVTPAMVDSIDPGHYVDVLRGQEGIWLSWRWGSIDGSARDNQRGSFGPIPSVRSYQGRDGCLTYMIDGVPLSRLVGNYWVLQGLRGKDIVAAEIYRYGGEVPPDLRNHSDEERPWTRSGASITGGSGAVYKGSDFFDCGLVAYWTSRGW